MLHDIFDGIPMFNEETVTAGDQFMACKPWKGAIKEPSKVPVINAEIPDLQYDFEFVHGYCTESYQNCLYNPDGHATYFTACLGIVLDMPGRTQKIFGGGEHVVEDVKKESKYQLI